MRSNEELNEILNNFNIQIAEMTGAKLDLREWLVGRIEGKIQQKIDAAFEGVFTGLSVRELEVCKTLLGQKPSQSRKSSAQSTKTEKQSLTKGELKTGGKKSNGRSKRK